MSVYRALHLTLSLLVALTAIVAASPPSAAAQDKVVDPRDIALTPDDLPAGFSIDRENSGYGPLPGVGVQLQIQMKRQPTPENLASGPVVVQQIIIRIDEPVPPEEALADARDLLIGNQGFEPTPEGPNDGGTVSLVKTDDQLKLYAIGFVKNDTVIFTMWGGLASVVDYPHLLTLAGISSARYDAVLAG
jgi:hypothetical protein